MAAKRAVQLVNFTNQVSYLKGLEIQRACQAKLIELRRSGEPHPGVVLLLEHPPVYTLGRGSKEEFVLDKSIEVVRTERGGEVTYHGPGQLVGYLILDLEFFKKDLHWMVRKVEESLIRTLKTQNITGERVTGKTGVWIGNSKVAAVGLGAKQWVTIHGFALNIFEQTLLGFQRIVPCGINAEAGRVTCLQSLAPSTTVLSNEEIRQQVGSSLSDTFGMALVETPRSPWLDAIVKEN